MTTLAGGFLVINYHDAGRKVSKSNLDQGRKQERPLRQTAVYDWRGWSLKFSFCIFPFGQNNWEINSIQLPRKAWKSEAAAKANYVGFELNRQKTEKPMSLNICCSRASQFINKNPPDRVVMLAIIIKIFKMANIVYKEKCPPLGSCPNKSHPLATAWMQSPRVGQIFGANLWVYMGGGGVMDGIDTYIIKM